MSYVQPDRMAQRPLPQQARELRSVYYDPETQMFRDPWRNFDYGVLHFWRWLVESGRLVGDGPAYGQLANRVISRGGQR
jgi:hypothetical protein